MSGKRDQDEPTMEEILASIRRIISEESEPVAAPAAEASAERASAHMTHDDILELTEVVEDAPRTEIDAPDPDDRDMDPGMDAHDVELAEDDEGFAEDDAADFPAADPAETAFEDEPEAEAEMEAMTPPRQDDAAQAPRQTARPADDWIDVVDPAGEDEAIMTAARAATVRDSFGQLSDLLVAGYAGSDKTLEGMVREMLRPMLKNWLDTNLPAIVERAVAREIARLARVKRP